MGDRANVEIKDGYSSVFLYTHWAGTELPSIVQRALKRKQRWDDPQYLARIVFCEMVKNNINGETGYGISARLHDGEDKIIVLSVNEQTVSWWGNHVSFDDFIKMESVGWK